MLLIPTFFLRQIERKLPNPIYVVSEDENARFYETSNTTLRNMEIQRYSTVLREIYASNRSSNPSH